MDQETEDFIERTNMEYDEEDTFNVVIFIVVFPDRYCFERDTEANTSSLKHSRYSNGI